MHETTILGTKGNVLARVWSDHVIHLQVGDTIDVDGSPASIVRVEGNAVHTMPAPPEGLVADFLRYHVLFRVFDGDVARWKRTLDGHDDAADQLFLSWLEERVAEEPGILCELREMVETSGLWPAE